MKFTQLAELLPYPPKVKATLSTLHADIITYVMGQFKGTFSYKSKVVALLNTLSYYTVSGDNLPTDWSVVSPFDNLELIDASTCETTLGKLYLVTKDITWDIEVVGNVKEAPTLKTVTAPDEPTKVVEPDNQPVLKPTPIKPTNIKDIQPTPKEHLYIQAPTIPRFDTNRVWLNKEVDGVRYVIYKTLPEVPTTQNEVSVTTDVTIMTPSELLKLYPNTTIRTRPATMYEDHKNLTMDPDIGVIIPVVGFSPKQVKDCVIRYPHWFKLLRQLPNGNFVNFYTHLEIDGELVDTLEVWSTLPESNKIPKSPEFIKEYVVRRYLLERDIKGVDHKYKMFGSFGPFLTLFMSAEEYKRLGYKDSVDIARQCVESRVDYKRSRNPNIRRVTNG